MKTKCRFVVLTAAAVFMLIADAPLFLVPVAPPLFEQLVSEAHAVLGVRRRTRRRTAVVVGSAAAAETAAAQQQTAAAQQETAAAQQQAAAAQQQAAQTAASVPAGTMVQVLPAGCTSVVKNNVNYFNCGGVFYKSAFQGNNLVYVVVQQP